MKFTLIFLTSLISNCLSHDRVIVGILTAEISEFSDVFTEYEKYESFLPASYVKWVEQGGARVVPIFFGKDQSYYQEIMSKINGILLPGGIIEDRLNGFSNAVQMILNIANEMNANGDFFTIFSIGTAMELMLYHWNGGKDIIEQCDIGRTSMSLTLPESSQCALYKSSPEHIKKLIKSHPIASFNTKRCHSKEAFDGSTLSSSWLSFSLNSDKNGKVFVSSVEHKTLPYYGFLFHPEKIAFEWAEQTKIPHTLATIEVSQYFANFFINECRKNKHWFASKEAEDSISIENYNPFFTGKRGSKFHQSYMFNRDDSLQQLSNLS